jgi:hypothetical protein
METVNIATEHKDVIAVLGSTLNQAFGQNGTGK